MPFEVDTSGWSGEGEFTERLIDRLRAIDGVRFVRVEDAPSTRSDADYNFISNELFVDFATTTREEPMIDLMAISAMDRDTEVTWIRRERDWVARAQAEGRPIDPGRLLPMLPAGIQPAARDGNGRSHGDGHGMGGGPGTPQSTPPGDGQE